MPVKLAAKPKFTCVACEDTGVSSKGTPCVPCVRYGRIKVSEEVVKKMGVSIVIKYGTNLRYVYE